MDNSLLLLIIIKKEINVNTFLLWIYHFIYDNGFVPYYQIYDNDWSCGSNLGCLLNEFEYNYFVTFLSCIGLLEYELIIKRLEV